MLVAYEFKMSLRELSDKMDNDEVGWWLAFMKRKDELNEKRQRELEARKRIRR
jgi:hypothetical protein